MALATISRVPTHQVLLILLASLFPSGVSADDTAPPVQCSIPDDYCTQPRFPLNGSTSIQASAIGILVGSIFVTLLLGLLNGLVLSIYSANLLSARVLVETGSERQRQQARALLNLRHHTRWFLVALIISKVALAEGLPILLQTVLGSTWQPMLAAFVLVAFFAEVLPLYVMPQHALFWAYHCWPLVWLLMLITAPVSYVVAFFFNMTVGPVTEQILHAREQLIAVLDIYDENGKYGGRVKSECVRIAKGALENEKKKLLSGPLWFSNLFNSDIDEDLELGIERSPALVVSWTTVQTVRLDEVVDIVFFKRIKEAGFSRFPVVGYAHDDPASSSGDESTTAVGSEGTLPEGGLRIYGYLHIRTLMGLGIKFSSNDEVLHVRDLQLDPISVVYDDMLIYDLLSIFQSNPANMAVVIRRPMIDELLTSPQYKDIPEGYVLTKLTTKKPVWWTTSDQSLSHEHFNNSTGRANTNVADGLLEPVGIVTFTDIVEAIFQKKSEPEQTIGKKGTEHGSPKKSPAKMDGSKSPFNPSGISSMRAKQTNGAFELQNENGGLIRRRNASGRTADDELTVEPTPSRRTSQSIDNELDEGFDNVVSQEPTGPVVEPATSSVYTEDHEDESSRQNLQSDESLAESSRSMLASPEELIQAGTLDRAYISRMLATDSESEESYELRTASMPVITFSGEMSTILPQAPRHFSLGGMMLPRLRQVSPLTQQNDENVRPRAEGNGEETERFLPAK